MRGMAVSGIEGYQRYVSPYKGFSCAHRVHAGGASCSQFAKQVFARFGMTLGFVLMVRRFRKCAASARLNAMVSQQEPDARPQNTSPGPWQSVANALDCGASAATCCCWPS